MRTPYDDVLYLEPACELSTEAEAKCKQILTAFKENRTINCTAYSEGHAAGWQEALLNVQSELANVALESPANRNESRPENFVIMLSDVDEVINKMLWLNTLERFGDNE